jgi:hypothetical protein
MKMDLIEKAMEQIGRPCTTKEIVDYMLKNKMVEPVKWDLRMDISRKLLGLKKWEVVDRVDQGHNSNKGYIWYLVKNGKPEHDKKTCKICLGRNQLYNHYLSRSLKSSNMLRLSFSR